MRVLGIPIEPPQAVLNRVLSDIGAIARAARTAPLQLEQILELGEEIAAIGRGVLEVAERLDRRAQAIMELGERLDSRAAEMLELGRGMQDLGHRIDDRGAEIVDRASRVVETGTELIAVMPTFERALEMASPLEGAIDRFGRLVDRLPGGAARRRAGDPVDPPAAGAPRPGSVPTPDGEAGARATPDRSTDPPTDRAPG